MHLMLFLAECCTVGFMQQLVPIPLFPPPGVCHDAVLHLTSCTLLACGHGDVEWCTLGKHGLALALDTAAHVPTP